MTKIRLYQLNYRFNTDLTILLQNGKKTDIQPNLAPDFHSMPKNKSAVIRYRIIDQCINDKRHPFPSLDYLARRCSEILDTDISPSTIEKDLAAMKKDHPVGHNAPIVYSKQEKGYAYSEAGFSISELNLEDEEWNALRFSAQLLHQYRDVPIFADFKNAIGRINTRFSLGIDTDETIVNQHVHFESSNATNGMEWIDMIYEAISNKCAIGFTYTNIYKKKTSAYTLVPYLLKEHRNRWYVIGWEDKRQDYLTFALDRVAGLEIIRIPQARRNDFNPDSFFKHATGIMEGDGKPMKVELSISDPISKLVLLEPIHPSQTILAEATDHVRIGLTVFVNEEFCLRLLGLGPWCQVKKPAALKQTMGEMIKKMGKGY